MKLEYVDPAVPGVQVFDLSGGRRFVLGRSGKDCDVTLRFRKDPLDPKSEEAKEDSLIISRRHLEIWLEAGRPMIISHNAAKITFIGEIPLQEEVSLALKEGMVIRIVAGPHRPYLSLEVAIRGDVIRLSREGADTPSRPPVELDAKEKQSLSVASGMLETSIMVVMFTDQVGSTSMADALGEKAFHKVRRERDKMQTEAITRGAAGQVIKSTGDGILCVFKTPKQAMERAVELQRSLTARNRDKPAGERISLRIGMDMGQVVIDRAINFDVFGMRVNVAARVMDRAEGGQILVTKSIFDAVDGWLSDVDFRLVATQKVRLKGVSEPVQLYRIAFDEPIDMDGSTPGPPNAS